MFLLVLHVGKGVRVGKRESRAEETGKATTASEAGCVPPIATRQLQEVPLQNG